MSYLKKFDDHFVSCPFNKQHRVLASKLQYHIVRCMVNYPNFEVCPYNACHRMVKEEYAEHVANCPNRSLAIDNGDVSVGRNKGGMVDVNEAFHFQYEDWTKDQ